ncbi:hypothetical protein T492DRAFT_885034 [Pavlovales sp. CCMP2436]|nr:hypothetical protein T492DRAFT_885034 [Pavlovales sp. CCMP2436]
MYRSFMTELPPLLGVGIVTAAAAEGVMSLPGESRRSAARSVAPVLALLPPSAAEAVALGVESQARQRSHFLGQRTVRSGATNHLHA